MTQPHDHPVVLVDRADRAIGVEDKMQVHRIGRLHRAFSIFVFDRRGRMLLQRRSATKYHSAGLWANTCCGHPRWGERVIDSGQRRLKEEMGFTCELWWASAIAYRADVGGGMIENEYDHVLFGCHDADPDPDALEVQEWDWRQRDAVLNDLHRNPNDYCAWFRLLLPSPAISASLDRAGARLRPRRR